MEIDLFCKPLVVSMNNGSTSINYNHAFDCVFKPNTGYEEIDEYSIVMCHNDDDFYFGIAPKSKFMFTNRDKGIKRNLVDIVEFREELVLKSVVDFITLHNYCCRRLREEINKLHPDYSLTKINKNIN